MRAFPDLLLVAGFALGTLGAAGFGPVTEPMAWPLFLGGVGLLAAGGLAARRARAAGRQAGDGRAGVSTFAAEIAAIRRIVTELDESEERLSGEAVRDRVERLLAEEYFDLTRKSDDLIAQLGFRDYARVWDGVATAERLLARCWSLCIDGYFEEGRAELPRARANLERAAEAAAALGRPRRGVTPPPRSR